MKNVKDFGAVGNGIANDTKAIQNAINAGGTAFFPPGTYLSGTIYLKSNGGIYLSAGAKIIASTNSEDYNNPDYCPQNQVFKEEYMAGTHLITAVEQENVSISGFGTIDGNSHFWVNETLKEDYCEFWGHPPASANRPAQMIFFAECKNVKVENVTLLNSPFWHLFFHGCTDVTVQGLTIKGERRQWVNDGIDIDCCSNVAVTNCLIDTGDDGITLRANGKPLKQKEAVCENVTVSNCVITSYLDYGIRIGVGNGIIKNCTFSNIIIKDSLNGIGITCRFSPNSSGVSAQNLSFSDMSVEAKCAISLKISNDSSHPPLEVPRHIRDIRFNNVFAQTNRSCEIVGFKNGECSDITFTGSKLIFTEEDPCNNRYPCFWTGKRDCAFYIENAKNISFNNFEISAEDSVKSKIVLKKAKNIRKINSRITLLNENNSK